MIYTTKEDILKDIPLPELRTVEYKYNSILDVPQPLGIFTIEGGYVHNLNPCYYFDDDTGRALVKEPFNQFIKGYLVGKDVVISSLPN